MAMSVTKFFRKYNKRLLAIFGVALMIVFLLPSTINQMSRRDSAQDVIGEAFGQKVRIINLQQAELETSLLDGLNRLYVGNNPNQQQQQQVPFNWHAFVGLSKQPELDYYLLIQEARNMGIVVSPEQAETMLKESKIPGEIINAMLQQQNIPLNNLRYAVANYLSVVNMLQVVSANVKISDMEMQNMFKLISNTMTTNILPFSAENFVDQVPEPDAKVLADYFATNKEKFRYPDRVQVEYIGANVEQIKQQIQIDPSRAQQYINNNPSEFMTTTQPTTKPGEKSPATATAPVQVPMESKQALAMAADKLKTQKAGRLANDAINEARSASTKFWNTAKLNTNGVFQKPETVSDYQKIADEFSKKHQIKLTYNRTGLISQQEAGNIPGISQTLVIEQQRPLFFADYAFRVIPLIEAPKKFSQEARFLVLFQDSDPLRDQMSFYSGNAQEIYFFRVIKTDKSHLPASLDEVKAEVVKAWKLEQAYKIAQEQAQKTLPLAQKQKLNDLAKSGKDKEFKKLLDKLKVQAVEPQTFARRSFGRSTELSAPQIPTVTGNTENFADVAFDKLWNQPSTQPSGEFTSIVVPDSEGKTAYLVQLVNKTPVTAERYKQVQRYFMQYVNRAQQQEFLQNWLMPENIYKRANFQNKLQKEEEQI
jgi:hypothetical protein